MNYKNEYYKYKFKYLNLLQNQIGGKKKQYTRKLKGSKDNYYDYQNDQLIKYDSNKDGLISLEEFLAKDKSKGPKASKGKIWYSYDLFVNVHDYFYILFLTMKKFEIMCVPEFIVKFDNYVDWTSVVFNLKTNKLTLGIDMEKEINKCRDRIDNDGNYNVRFIFFSLIILPAKGKSNHANIIIIDLFKHTLERFEPHGYFKNNYQKNIDKAIKNKLMKEINLGSFEYLPPQKLSPKFGIQNKADAFCGMCVTITMMYLHMRVLNPDIEQKRIVNYFLKKSEKKLRDTMLRYAKFVEDTMKKNKKVIYNFDDELIKKM
jgi:hypothetical protein